MASIAQHQHKPIRLVRGKAHDEDGESGMKCLICMPSLRNADPFLFDCRTLDAERDAIANYVASNEKLIPDALTWLSARCDWERAYNVNFYFRDNYPQIEAACNRVNALPPHELNGERLAEWGASSFSDDTLRPLYCSWCHVPSKLEKPRAFYVRTKLPLMTDIFQYLQTVLHPPATLIEAITRAEQSVNSTSDFITVSRIDQRLHYRRKLSSSDLLASLDREQPSLNDLDLRDSRANDLDAQPKLKEKFTGHTPRLVFIPMSDDLVTLEPRPDYIFHAHKRYVNVFSIELPPNSPVKWEDVGNVW